MPAPYRILFVSYTADWTGPTNSLLLLLRHLRSRYHVAVLLPGRGAFSEALARDRISVFSLSTLTKRAIPRMVNLIRRERFDLVYGNSTHGGARNALVAARIARLPFVWHVRAVAAAWPWHRFISLSFADAVVAVSHACAAPLRKYVAGDKLRVVHNGVDPDRFEAKATPERERIWMDVGISGRVPVLIFLGHLKPPKGQEYAVRALGECARQGIGLELLLVGSHERDSGYVAYLESLVDRLGLADHVKLVGFRRDVPALLAAANVCVHSSLDEAHPRAILEAMASGLPVIAFEVGGVPEIVVDGRTGYLVRKGDVGGFAEAMAALASDPELGIRMGAEGRRRVRADFSAETTAEKVHAIIEEVLEGRRR